MTTKDQMEDINAVERSLNPGPIRRAWRRWWPVVAWAGWLLLVWVLFANAADAEPLGYYTVTPCRFLDTRTGPQYWYERPGPWDERYRVFLIQGTCGVPYGAKAVVLNVTAIAPTAPLELTFMSNTETSGPASVYVAAGKTRANGVLARLDQVPPTGTYADIQVLARIPGGTVHVTIDVLGYYR